MLPNGIFSNYPGAYWTQDMEFADGIPIEAASTKYLEDEYGDYDISDYDWEGGGGEETNTQEQILVNGYQGIIDG